MAKTIRMFSYASVGIGFLNIQADTNPFFSYKPKMLLKAGVEFPFYRMGFFNAGFVYMDTNKLIEDEPNNNKTFGGLGMEFSFGIKI